MPVLQHFDCCIFVIGFEIRKYESFDFALLFQYDLSNMSISANKGNWDFYKDCDKSVDQSGVYCSFNNISPPIYEQEIFFYLFKASLFSFNDVFYF